MRISDWSSDVCSSDLPGIWCPLSLLGAERVSCDRSREQCHGVQAELQAPAQRARACQGTEEAGKAAAPPGRSEERRGGKSGAGRGDLGGRRISKKEIRTDANI